MSEELALRGVHVSDMSLEFTEPPDWDQWLEVGETLKRIEGAVMWWVGDWYAAGEFHYGDQAAQAVGGETGFSETTVLEAYRVASRFENPRRLGNLSWSHHQVVAALEPDEQDARLQEAVDLSLSVHEFRSHVRRQKALQRSAGEPPPVDDLGPFEVLYADPPWRYEFVETESRAVENQYPTMSLDEIKVLHPPVTDDAMLFLWATSPKLEEALEVVTAWGFTYRSCMVWVKDRIGMGYYARQRHELLLVCRRGDFPVPTEDTRPDSVIEAPRGQHSEKPEVVYELLERMYPSAAKAELFARQRRDGWAVWGNDLALVAA